MWDYARISTKTRSNEFIRFSRDRLPYIINNVLESNLKKENIILKLSELRSKFYNRLPKLSQGFYNIIY